MKVLVLGTPGQLGHELMRAVWPSDVTVAGVGYPDFDMAKPGDVEAQVAAHAPDAVVNATAYTAVDKAESERELAFAINAGGVERLGAACAARGVPVIHVSSDYVFDGTKAGRYVESDPTCPINVYGESKAVGEAALRAANPRHVILRTSWVYAAHGANFVKTMQRLGAEREELGVVADQVGAPTTALDLAAAIVRIVPQLAGRDATGTDGGPFGTYHLTNGGETSWHGFAEAIFADMERRTGRRPRLKAIATADYPTPARRPANSRLDCGAAAAKLGITLPSWQDGLERVLAELNADAATAGKTS